MGLSNELISQFVKVTNDAKVSRVDEVTLYGEVVKCDDSVCVKFDGSDELTPVTTITEKDENGNVINFKYGAASVKTGDRVSVSLKNHSATITGNLSDPPMGRAEVIINDDSIVAKVGEDVQVKLDAFGVKIDGLTTFTNGLSDGTTSIDGACIKTGTIDAKRISLKGLIAYEYSVDGINDWHYPMATADMFRRETIDGGETWGDPYQFKGKNGQNGSDASVPSYIELRGIDFTDMTNSYIKSPKIYAGEFHGIDFNVHSDGSEGAFNLYGTFGGNELHVLSIAYWEDLSPVTCFYSPVGGPIEFGRSSNPSTFRFYASYLDFTGVEKIAGLTAEFA